MSKYFKKGIGLALLFVTNFLYAQLTPEQQDSIARNLAPLPDSAIVYIIRTSSLGFAIRMDVSCDSVYIGTTGAKTYIYTVLAPGTHNFLSRSENKFFLDVTVEANKIYYLEQQVKMGMIYARTKLNPVEEETGKKMLSKCKLDHTNMHRY
ncbi:MAG: DUF2846 domain-containing protein [Ferruginibacter sp.]